MKLPYVDGKRHGTVIGTEGRIEVYRNPLRERQKAWHEDGSAIYYNEDGSKLGVVRSSRIENGKKISF